MPKFKFVCPSVQPGEWDGHTDTHTDDAKTITPITPRNNHFHAQTGQTYVKFAVDLQKLQLYWGSIHLLTRILNVSRSAVFFKLFGHLLPVLPQLILPRKCLLTNFTRKWFFSSVSSDVFLTFSPSFEFPLTNGTKISLLVSLIGWQRFETLIGWQCFETLIRLLHFETLIRW